MKTKAVPALLALVVLSSLALAASVPGPKQVGRSKAFIAQNWTFDFGDTLPPTFSFKTFGFPSTPVHKARMEPGSEYGYTQKTDELGNLVLEFSFTPKNRVEVVSLRSFIDTDYSALQPAAGAGVFLSGGPLSQANPEMAAKARELAGSGKSKMEQLVSLTGWAHNRVKYDGFGYGSTIFNASWVYYNKLGTCDEYSHLLIAMLRAVGIPSKFVAGYVCSSSCGESQNWGPHAWVEAFVDGNWVSADPTFNEAILLDATHVKFAEGKDQDDIKEQLSVVAFNFPLGNVKLERSALVSLDEWQGFADSFDLQLEAPEKTVGEKSIETVIASVKSKSSQPIAVPLSIVTPVEMRVRGEPDVLLFLQPGGQANHSWNVVLPEELKQGFVYNFTVEVSALGESVAKSIIAKKGGDTQLVESIRIRELQPTLEENSLKLVVEVENEGNKKAEDAVVRIDSNAGSASQTVSLEPGGRKSLEFLLAKPAGAESVQGSIVVSLGSQQVRQPFNIRLSVETPTPTAIESQHAGQLGLSLSTEQLVLTGAVAIVLILALALFLLKPR